MLPMHPCPQPQSRLGTAKPVHPFRNRLVPLLSALALARFAAAGQNSPAAAGPPQTVRQIKVQPDQAPDCTSLKTIAESVTLGCRNNDEKAVAIYNFIQLAHTGSIRASRAGPVLQEFHCYGWSLCGGLHVERRGERWRRSRPTGGLVLGLPPSCRH